jgi:hypothetical protein
MSSDEEDAQETNEEDNLEMRDGAFVLVDCLGFRGAWKREPERLIQKLHDIRHTVEEGLGDSKVNELNPEDIDFRIVLLSDTVAMSFQPKKDLKNVELVGWAVERAVMVVPDVIRLFLQDDPVLTLRGCVSCGQHLCAGNFLVGPAVDAAAENMNIAQGAFVWLLPAAAERYHAWRRGQVQVYEALNEAQAAENLRKMPLVERHRRPSETATSLLRRSARIAYSAPHTILYPMALNSGGSLKVEVINPFYKGYEFAGEDYSQLFSQALVGDNISVWQKRQNTLDFLKVAKRTTEEHLARH